MQDGWWTTNDDDDAHSESEWGYYEPEPEPYGGKGGKGSKGGGYEGYYYGDKSGKGSKGSYYYESEPESEHYWPEPEPWWGWDEQYEELTPEPTYWSSEPEFHWSSEPKEEPYWPYPDPEPAPEPYWSYPDPEPAPEPYWPYYDPEPAPEPYWSYYQDKSGKGSKGGFGGKNGKGSKGGYDNGSKGSKGGYDYGSKGSKGSYYEPEPEWGEEPEPNWPDDDKDAVAAEWAAKWPETDYAGWNSDGWDSDGHCKHDINYVRKQVTKLIKDSERELIPKFLRLGFHDCVGGCDGCVDMTNPDNQGLQEPIDAIYPIVDKFKASYSRADIWAMATLVSADLAVVDGRPHGYHFLMRYIGRHDCSGADAKGVGGPDITMPTNDLTTHELLAFFAKNFEFDLAETVTVMGVHAVAVAHRENIGFGNIGKEDGWVYKADDYELNNRYYDMLVGDDMSWQIELVHNEGDIPSRYQWFQEKKGETERPIMTNSDMGLARDLSAYMNVDEDGNTGAVSCVYKSEEEETNNESGSDSGSGGYMRERTLKNKPAVCPVAHDTVEMMLKYREDNELFLIDFEHVLEKMLKSGYHGQERKLTRIIH